jgi:hypothetical protein
MVYCELEGPTNKPCGWAPAAGRIYRESGFAAVGDRPVPLTT